MPRGRDLCDWLNAPRSSAESEIIVSNWERVRMRWLVCHCQSFHSLLGTLGKCRLRNDFTAGLIIPARWAGKGTTRPAGLVRASAGALAMQGLGSGGSSSLSCAAGCGGATSCSFLSMGTCMVSVILFMEGFLDAGAEPAGRGAAVCFFGTLLGANICFFRLECKKKEGDFKKKFLYYFQLVNKKIQVPLGAWAGKAVGRGEIPGPERAISRSGITINHPAAAVCPFPGFVAAAFPKPRCCPAMSPRKQRTGAARCARWRGARRR